MRYHRTVDAEKLCPINVNTATTLSYLPSWWEPSILKNKTKLCAKYFVLDNTIQL